MLTSSHLGTVVAHFQNPPLRMQVEDLRTGRLEPLEPLFKDAPPSPPSTAWEEEDTALSAASESALPEGNNGGHLDSMESSPSASQAAVATAGCASSFAAVGHEADVPVLQPEQHLVDPLQGCVQST